MAHSSSWQRALCALPHASGRGRPGTAAPPPPPSTPASKLRDPALGAAAAPAPARTTCARPLAAALPRGGSSRARSTACAAARTLGPVVGWASAHNSGHLGGREGVECGNGWQQQLVRLPLSGAGIGRKGGGGLLQRRLRQEEGGIGGKTGQWGEQQGSRQHSQPVGRLQHRHAGWGTRRGTAHAAGGWGGVEGKGGVGQTKDTQSPTPKYPPVHTTP